MSACSSARSAAILAWIVVGLIPGLRALTAAPGLPAFCAVALAWAACLALVAAAPFLAGVLLRLC